MLAQLESKILDLQTQIESTQEQITDYQTNPAYVDFYYFCHICGKNNAKNNVCSTQNRQHRYRNTLRPTYFFTKTAELAQAQASLATLQNELKNTQEQYELKTTQAQYIARAMILNQAFVSPPPKQNTSKPKSA